MKMIRRNQDTQNDVKLTFKRDTSKKLNIE